MDRHNEAGLMKACLSEGCGIGTARIHIDGQAATTRGNAVNPLDILNANGIRTTTIAIPS